ncbi:MAG: hypothetical protein L0H53_05590 [Candidatus Nitrosocosmicus sp.]|nr:hypothetical protein [Candidatus Nitrosocosmicus sp.]MDN5868452.1 hypothetical protein [Candidatus Nitrosocosmicus sp.]
MKRKHLDPRYYSRIHKIDIDENLKRVGIQGISVVKGFLIIKTMEIDLDIITEDYENPCHLVQSVTKQIVNHEINILPQFIDGLKVFLRNNYDTINNRIQDLQVKNYS